MAMKLDEMQRKIKLQEKSMKQPVKEKAKPAKPE
jgi:hypothetical protein